MVVVLNHVSLSFLATLWRKKNQLWAIRCEFELVGPIMFKNPFGAGWGLLPTLRWVSSCSTLWMYYTLEVRTQRPHHHSFTLSLPLTSLPWCILTYSKMGHTHNGRYSCIIGPRPGIKLQHAWTASWAPPIDLYLHNWIRSYHNECFD